MTPRLSRRLPQGLAAAICAHAALAAALAAQDVRDPRRFQHEIHSSYPCTDCHSSGRATSVTNRAWCAECHHQNVGYDQCQRCHATEEIAPEPIRALVAFDLSVGLPVMRSLTFDHGRHSDLGCGSCHTTGAAVDLRTSCTGCHVEHHQQGRDCSACHAEPPVTAHPATVHLDLTGCGAAGCHVSEGIDFAALPDERNLCLACHVAQREHEAPEPCASCHIPGEPPEPGGARR